MAAGFEEVEGAIDIGGEIELGLPDRGPDPGSGGEVNDGVEFAPFKDAVDEVGITNVSFDHLYSIKKARDVEALDFGIIVVVEVVDDGDLVSLIQKGLDEVGSDKASSAGDQVVHGKTIVGEGDLRRGRIEESLGRAIKLGKAQQIVPQKTGTLYQGVSSSFNASQSR